MVYLISQAETFKSTRLLSRAETASNATLIAGVNNPRKLMGQTRETTTEYN